MVSSRDGASRSPADLIQPTDPSGVHTRAEPKSADEWRATLVAEEGAPSPGTESLLAAYEALEWRARAFERRALAAQLVCDRMSISVHVVSERGVVFANTAAEALEASGVLKREEGALVCTGFEAREELAEAIAEAQKGSRVQRPFVLLRDRKPRLHGLVLSAGRALPGAAIVVLSDPTAPPAADADIYVRHFGLTPAEGRVAERLAVGQTPRQIARQLGIGVETVRTHVKSILRKLSVNRQVDAVRLLVTGPLLLA